MSSDSLLQAASALRHFLHLSGAVRAQALVDDTPPAVVSVSRLGPIELIAGDQERQLEHGVQLPQPPELGDVRQLPPFEVDAEHGEVRGTIGGLQQMADGVLRLAEALGGRSAAVVELETTTPELALVLSARNGEPVLVTLGDETYEL